MPLINFKVELKLKYVLSAADAEKDYTYPNNFLIPIKNIMLYAPVVTLSTKYNENYENFIAKDLRDQFIGMNIFKHFSSNLLKNLP